MSWRLAPASRQPSELRFIDFDPRAVRLRLGGDSLLTPAFGNLNLPQLAFKISHLHPKTIMDVSVLLRVRLVLMAAPWEFRCNFRLLLLITSLGTIATKSFAASMTNSRTSRGIWKYLLAKETIFCIHCKVFQLARHHITLSNFVGVWRF